VSAALDRIAVALERLVAIEERREARARRRREPVTPVEEPPAVDELAMQRARAALAAERLRSRRGRAR
jgi:hypothetical protein